MVNASWCNIIIKLGHKIMSMFPVVHQKIAMHDAIFISNFIDIKTAMGNLFLNRIGRYRHTNYDIGRGHILFDIY